MSITKALAALSVALTPAVSHAAVTKADFSGETIIETFEGELPDFLQPNPLSLNGVTYTGYYYGNLAEDLRRSFLCGTTCLTTARGDAVVDIDLGGSFYGVGIEAFSIFGGVATLEAYDEAGELIGTVSGQSAAVSEDLPPEFLGLRNDLGAITAVRLIQTGGTAAWEFGTMNFDNLYRDPGAPVPVPAAAVLFLGGLGLLRAARRG